MLRNTTITLNSIVVVFFACFLSYTFVAREHLESVARNYVTDKTRECSNPIIEVAEESLKSPLTQKLLSEDQRSSIQQEIKKYRDAPEEYIAGLTGKKNLAPPLDDPNPLVKKVTSIKKSIRVYYDETLHTLIVDLRIFSFSNMIAGAIAFYLAFHSSAEIRKPIVWFSFLMFVAVLYSSVLYVDDLTFFRILFRTHLGWWYPVFLGLMIVALLLDYGRLPIGSSENHSSK